MFRASDVVALLTTVLAASFTMTGRVFFGDQSGPTAEGDIGSLGSSLAVRSLFGVMGCFIFGGWYLGEVTSSVLELIWVSSSPPPLARPLHHFPISVVCVFKFFIVAHSVRVAALLVLEL